VKIVKKALAATLFTLMAFIAAPVRSNAAAKSCMVSSGQWVNSSLGQVKSGSFRVTYDATAGSNSVDAVTGLSSSSASQYTNLAAVIRFNLSGTLDALNGSSYAASSAIHYTAGVKYHFILDVNVTTHTYSAYVMMGAVQTAIGTGFAFRTEQAYVASLSYVSGFSSIGSHTICDINVVTAAVAPAITAQPSNVAVKAGQTANFWIASTGTAPLTYQWKKNGAAISGATSSNYTTAITVLSDNSAQFTAVVTNAAGTATSNAATLTVTAPVVAPSITSQPMSQTITAGQAASFSVATTGTAPMTYQWNRNGSAIGGAVSSSYTTALTTSADNGAQFSVVVTNGAGSVSSTSALLTVKAAVPPPGCLLSSANWVSAPLAQVQTSSFRVQFDITPSASNMDGVAGLSSTPAAAYTDLAAAVRFNQGGTIDARNGAGYAAATALPYTPGITYHFILDINIGTHTYDAYVLIGSVQTLIGSKFAFRTEQAAVTSLGYLSGLASTGSDTICNAAISAAAAIAPSITSQPVGKTVSVGQTATFSVTAAGTATLTYQWKKNAVAISGATAASYTTAATIAADNAAQFSVVVNNAAGTVTSSNATLTVSAPATLLLNSSSSSLSFGSVNVASSGTQNVTMTNAGNSNVTIGQVMVAGAGFNSTGASGIILAPGQSTTLTSTFAPSASGAAAGSITVSSNASNSPSSISLTGMGVAAVNHTASLSWAAAVSGVTGFNAYSSSTPGGPYTKLTFSPVTSPSYTDSSVQSGRTYYYVVTAVNASNQESGYSSEVSAIVP
jgi:hypothetical protein